MVHRLEQITCGKQDNAMTRDSDFDVYRGTTTILWGHVLLKNQYDREER